MKQKDKTDKLICPCCKEQKLEKDLIHLLKWRKQYSFPYLGLNDELDLDDEEKVRWACDACIKTKRAILAQPKKQDYSCYPYFVYFDIKRNCNSCNREYIYTKEEQFFWYEELGNNYWSRANNCWECRRIKREEKNKNIRLSKLLETPIENDISSLTEVIEIYLNLGKYDKAKFYMSKFRKLAKNTGFDEI
ncbi:zinc-ribbon domain containing protein [Flammeovirga sp. EKP202]|uniref:zinc-ribbon domain containing protein n=1 Tax=Flammeovirga sp. EKP202 TaxID=2770592 RepID=UPI00165F8A8A|nr:zinc-ribbon domain containing protein [Flammeovirga sp. EKP202]MBD0404087.1 zinc-ribbon domain containing protein [Flammeovirga sp. EKP202]